MSTTARLGELKRDLARLERKGRGFPGKSHDVESQRGWFDVLWRAWGEVGETNMFLIAGGVTYALLLALFPGLAALVSLYGLVFDPAQIEQQFGAVSAILPTQTQQPLGQQLHSLVSA